MHARMHAWSIHACTRITHELYTDTRVKSARMHSSAHTPPPHTHLATGQHFSQAHAVQIPVLLPDLRHTRPRMSRGGGRGRWGGATRWRERRGRDQLLHRLAQRGEPLLDADLLMPAPEPGSAGREHARARRSRGRTRTRTRTRVGSGCVCAGARAGACLTVRVSPPRARRTPHRARPPTAAPFCGVHCCV